MVQYLSDVYVGSSPASAVASALQINQSATTPTSSAKPDRFWSSQADFANSTAVEILEINLSTASLINRINFEAVKFPQTITVEYSSDTSDNWEPILDAVTGNPLNFIILDSFPKVLPNRNAVSGHAHPQHDYDGHWQRYANDVKPAAMQKIRFLIQRNPQGNLPIDATGNPIAYSVAMQNIYLGYEISSEHDIPRALMDNQTSHQVFANTSDIFGSNLGFSKRVNYASNLLFNSDVDAPLIWKSEPQPFPNAVVNFYADLRDNSGNAQAIDKIFIDPLYNGCKINLYYSNDQVGGDFKSSTQALSGTQAVFVNGSVALDGSLNLTAQGAVQLDNSYLAFDPSAPWWIGVEFTSTVDLTTDTSNHPLFDCGTFQVGFNASGLYLSAANGDYVPVPLSQAILQGTPAQVVFGIANCRYEVAFLQGVESIYFDLPQMVPYSNQLPFQMMVGSDINQTVFSDSYINAFVLKQEVLNDKGQGFLNDPSDYSTVSIIPANTLPGDTNSILRYDSSLIDDNSPTGFIGGPAFNYDSLNWTLIPREYEMQRGNMQVPVTRAKFWNLEITNLRPEVNEKFVPVTRTVKTFPPEVLSRGNEITKATNRAGDVGLDVANSLSRAVTFNDIPQYVGTGSNGTGYTPTEVYVATDYETKERLRSVGSEWNYVQLHPDRNAPRFEATGVHNYSIQQIKQTTNVSYFCGLRQIIFGRNVTTTPQEYPVIEETFVDGSGISSGTWQLAQNGIYSGSSAQLYARTTSVLIPTQRAVRGLQFATQQSDAKEIVIKGEFSYSTYDPNDVTAWSAYGDGKVLGLTSSPFAGNSSLLVSRQVDKGFWADIALNYPTYGDLEANHVTYGMLAAGSQLQQYDGGIQSEAVTLPMGGRIHATARITATDQLSKPLWIQIIDSDTGGVLAEEQSNVGKNEVKEWYSSIDISNYGTKVGRTWGDLRGQVIWPSFADSFIRANAINLGKMDTGQTWVAGPNGSLSISSNAATVTSTGQLNSIDLGTEWGTLTFTIGNLITTGTAPLVDLGGFLLFNTGAVQPYADTNTMFTLSLAAGHQYSFQFIPTSQVPVGQQMTGADPTVQPYSMIIKDNGTWVRTLSSARAFNSVRALMGYTGQTFTQFGWSPGTAQNFLTTNVYTVPIPGTMDTDGGTNFFWNGWNYQGQYTFTVGPNLSATSNTQNNIASLSGSAFLAAPSGVTTTPGTGGTFPAGTYFWRVTAVNVNGETLSSSEVTATLAANASMTLNWTAVAGATSYNIYRSTASNNELYIDSSTSNSYIDYGTVDSNGNLLVGTTPYPTVNTTNLGGRAILYDFREQYGALAFRYTQMPSGLANGVVRLAYLNYNPTSGKIITLRGDGTIYDEVNQTTIKSSMFANPLAGSIVVRYVPAQALSSVFQTTWGIAVTDTQAMIFLQSNTVVGVYSGQNIWDTTVRGLGGANNGTGAGQYTIAEGPAWYTDGALLVPNSAGATYAQVSYAHTRTYADMEFATTGTTKSVAVRVIQKEPTLDAWFVESATLFWDPIIWEFSCDGGITWWEALDIRNNPNGAMLFPYGLTNYSKLRWRVTSYSGNVTISHLAIRPWYLGAFGATPPLPLALPQGPNIVNTDSYAAVEDDPRWQVWDKPIPRWWWYGYQPNSISP